MTYCLPVAKHAYSEYKKTRTFVLHLHNRTYQILIILIANKDLYISTIFANQSNAVSALLVLSRNCHSRWNIIIKTLAS